MKQVCYLNWNENILGGIISSGAHAMNRSSSRILKNALERMESGFECGSGYDVFEASILGHPYG